MVQLARICIFYLAPVFAGLLIFKSSFADSPQPLSSGAGLAITMSHQYEHTNNINASKPCDHTCKAPKSN